MYRRLLEGIVDRGRTRDLLKATEIAVAHQGERGIRARTAVWAAMTGQTNTALIAMDFNTLEDLERMSDLSVEDSQFAGVWDAVLETMVPEQTTVAIQRLAFHSQGLISAEEATAPRHFMRIMTGDVLPGRHREFVLSISEALTYQTERGVDATTSVWSSLSGGTNSIAIVGEFDSMTELQEFDDMALQDAEFARLRRATRETMAFLTTHVDLMRNLL